MELIDINKEIVRIGTNLGLNVVDDKEYLKGGVLWIEEIYKSKMQGNKSNKKSSFYILVNAYEVNANKAKLYEVGQALSKAILEEFMADNNEYEVKVEQRQEQMRKVSMDTGKLYEYSFTFTVEAYKRLIV